MYLKCFPGAQFTVNRVTCSWTDMCYRGIYSPSVLVVLDYILPFWSSFVFVQINTGGRLDRRQTEGGVWGQLQGSLRSPGKNAKTSETSGLRGRNRCKYWQDWENQTGKMFRIIYAKMTMLAEEKPGCVLRKKPSWCRTVVAALI